MLQILLMKKIMSIFFSANYIDLLVLVMNVSVAAKWLPLGKITC